MKKILEKATLLLLIVAMAGFNMGEVFSYEERSGSADERLHLYEEMLANGEITEEQMMQSIQCGGFSQNAVQQLLNDGYMQQYDAQLKQEGWVDPNYVLPSGSSSSSTGTSSGTSTGVTYTQEEIDNAWTENKRVEATCAEAGYIQYKNKLTGKTKKEELPKLEHTYTKTEVPATCIELGLITYTCEVCGDSKTEEIPMIEHSYKSSEKVEATCTDNGKEVFSCSVCQDTHEEVFMATGHDDGEWVVVKDAGAFKDGLEELQCTKCKEVLASETIEKKGIFRTIYDFLFGWMKPAEDAEHTDVSEKASTETTELETVEVTEVVEETEVNKTTGIFADTEELTQEVSERNKAYRTTLTGGYFAIEGYVYGAQRFNIVDINCDGVPELICNTKNDADSFDADAVNVWGGDIFLGGFEEFTECRLTYIPEDGLFLCYTISIGDNDFIGEVGDAVYVWAVNPEVEYGVECIKRFKMINEGEKVYYIDNEVVDENTYQTELAKYTDKELVLDAPYEITEENLDLLLPVLD